MLNFQERGTKKDRDKKEEEVEVTQDSAHGKVPFPVRDNGRLVLQLPAITIPCFKICFICFNHNRYENVPCSFLRLENA